MRTYSSTENKEYNEKKNIKNINEKWLSQILWFRLFQSLKAKGNIN
jgi:hypothetical protein